MGLGGVVVSRESAQCVCHLRKSGVSVEFVWQVSMKECVCRMCGVSVCRECGGCVCQVCVSPYTCLYVYVCMYVCVYVCVCVAWVCVCVNVYKYMNIHIYIRTHTFNT